jgi:hypothetical protein
MRQDPEYYDGREMELVYIAAALDEAKRVEAVLDEHGIDYAVQVEQYRSGVIFASVRPGAFFYVLPEVAARSREVIGRLGYKVQEPLE